MPQKRARTKSYPADHDGQSRDVDVLVRRQQAHHGLMQILILQLFCIYGNQLLRPNINSPDQLAPGGHSNFVLPKLLQWSIAAYSVESLLVIDSCQKFG